ncbi:MAG: hypothetical protein WCO56_01230 [Verrucomicrobiota bacterium]
MKPTPFELAQIAATLALKYPTDPEKLMTIAHDLWNTAAVHLEGPRHPINTYHVLKLDDVLAELMPNERPAMRKKKFHQFLLAEKRAYISSFGEGQWLITDELEQEKAIREMEQDYRKNGVLSKMLELWKTAFPIWRKAKTKEGRVKAALASQERQAKAIKAAKKQQKAPRTSRVVVEAADWEQSATGKTPIRSPKE